MFSLNKITLWLFILLGGSGSLLAQPRDGVTVYAAASLKDALDALLMSRQGIGLGAAKAVYGASSTLARQIERGAPADVFISADTAWMDYLAQHSLLRDGTRVNLLSNRLVLIAPANFKSALVISPKFPLAAALGNERLAVADPDSVPAGKYGKSALQALGVWNEVSRKLAPTENVRAALMLVARGEALFGIVYASDALAEPRVRVQGTFPENSHAPIVYPAALLTQSRSLEAGALLDYLSSDSARTVWRKFGFGLAH
jgi:molybdate transport system substrate-binding protein